MPMPPVTERREEALPNGVWPNSSDYERLTQPQADS
jgi:hypothetical protein